MAAADCGTNWPTPVMLTPRTCPALYSSTPFPISPRTSGSPSPIMDSVLAAVGERGPFYWPTKTLLASGAEVAPGSDWPAAVPSMNPWSGIEALITRADPFADTEKTLWLDEAITLEEALKMFTVNGARALRTDDVTGSITVGKSADFIVLNQNLMTIDPRKISDTQVTSTYFAGRLVHGQ